jgi:SAM-dependent methyltransferase
MLTDVARRGRSALRRTFPALGHTVHGAMSGRFQAYSHTSPDRYPWLFGFAVAQLGADRGLRILSFGCSRGDEVFALRSYFPAAVIHGIDIDARNIASCVARVQREKAAAMTFAIGASTAGEESGSYDAIFCLAVLCLGDLTSSGAERCDPQLHFADFERLVTDFARCLKSGGLLLLHTTNFRFCDTAIARDFDVLLEATPEQMATDVQFDRDNQLLHGARYCAVAFRKK